MSKIIINVSFTKSNYFFFFMFTSLLKDTKKDTNQQVLNKGVSGFFGAWSPAWWQVEVLCFPKYGRSQKKQHNLISFCILT